jgi:hypothetical protein
MEQPSINFGIINSITKMQLVGISTESSTMHGSINIKFINAKQVVFMFTLNTSVPVKTIKLHGQHEFNCTLLHNVYAISYCA